MSKQEILHDISRRISPDAAVYPGDDPLGFSTVCVIGDEAPCNITGLSGWTTHFLTHLDPPRHFVPGGASLDEIPLARFVGPAIVVDVSGDVVTMANVPEGIQGKSVLFKTRNSNQDPAIFDENHVYIDKSAADLLVERAPNLVGIDYLSVDRFGDEEYPAHRGLLGHNILVLEGLDLSGVTPGLYRLVALPLKIKEGDGSPARAILIEER